MLIPKNKIRILIADKINPDGLRHLPSKYFIIEKKLGLSNKEILEKFSDNDVLVIRSTRKIDRHFLENCNLKIIASCTKGLDHIDIKTAHKKGIKIINSEAGNTVSAAEHTFALILSVCKKINLSDNLVRKGNFSFTDFTRNELRGKRIGIIGFGKVGSRVARYAEAFEMQVLANDIDEKVRKRNRKYKFSSLQKIFSVADIVTIHIPLNENNHKFITDKKLDYLSKKAILINTSRGEVIEEKALIKKLKSGKIYFAGLDVFINEPKIDSAFFMLKNVILTNHIAGKTEESNKYISNDIFMQVKKYFLLK